MKKILSITILSLCLLGVSFLSFLSFFPWENLSWYGTEKLEKIFADQGISLRMSPPEVEGLFPPRMAIANITLESPLFQFRSSNIRGVLHPFQSLISSGLEGGFALGKGSLEGGGSRLLWDDGKGEVRAAPPLQGLRIFVLPGLSALREI